TGTPLPTQLRRAAPALQVADALHDALHDAPRTHIDDEYATAADHAPRVLVTTSRAPSARLSQFAKELRLLLPGATRLNRGNLVVSQLVASCRANAFSDLIIAHEHRGQPDGLIVSHLPYGPTAFFNISNCVMRHDVHERLPNMSEALPHLLFHNFNTDLGARVVTVLKHLFPPPKQTSRRVITFANFDDTISMRHHTFVPAHSAEHVQLTEAGPRFELQLYQLRLGTVDNGEADNEWVLRPHMNTAKRRRALG
ncbi:unnamed protein product, partial [Agarophyton chilense]